MHKGSAARLLIFWYPPSIPFNYLKKLLSSVNPNFPLTFQMVVFTPYSISIHSYSQRYKGRIVDIDSTHQLDSLRKGWCEVLKWYQSDMVQ